MNRFSFIQPVDLLDLCVDGKRVRLRSIHEKYAPEIFREFTEEVTRYMSPSPPKSMDDVAGFRSRWEERLSRRSPRPD
jgi:[ribosomal protein S5]-alanine N-acetyltransferase